MKKKSKLNPPVGGQTSKFKIRKGRLSKAIVLGLIVYIVFLFIKGLYSSSFFQRKDRINVVISEDKIGFYSLGLTDNVNYFLSFFPDLEVVVPGGYGYYRLGALSKLASLEKKSDIIKKAYSMATSSFVDFYFYPSASSEKMQVLFGKEKKDFFLPSFNLIFFGKSNALLFDRIYLYLQFLGKTQGNYKIIPNLNVENLADQVLFLADEFFKDQQGIFYKKTYRNEQRNVQIVYTNSYKTAQVLGQILEGEGIRVVDLTQTDDKEKKCKVIEDKKSFSQSAKSISRFFVCQLVSAKTGTYDIIFELGEAEKEWEVE